jgi:glycine/D-amino acid oxidase-like deaminating enzyme
VTTAAEVVVVGAGILGCSIAVHLIAAEVATQTADGLLAPFRPARFAERVTRVMLEVESVFRDPAHHNRST